MGLQNETSSNVVSLRDSADGFQHGVVLGAAEKLGFYGATPVVQATPTNLTATAAAGSTTSVFVNTTFNGGSGTAYTVGDVVAILKSIGLLKA
jgi:ABC-type sulfate transport system permease subunit